MTNLLSDEWTLVFQYIPIFSETKQPNRGSAILLTRSSQQSVLQAFRSRMKIFEAIEDVLQTQKQEVSTIVMDKDTMDDRYYQSFQNVKWWYLNRYVKESLFMEIPSWKVIIWVLWICDQSPSFLFTPSWIFRLQECLPFASLHTLHGLSVIRELTEWYLIFKVEANVVKSWDQYELAFLKYPAMYAPVFSKNASDFEMDRFVNKRLLRYFYNHQCHAIKYYA